MRHSTIILIPKSDEVLFNLTFQLRQRYWESKNNYTYPSSEFDIDLVKEIARDHGIPEFMVICDDSIFYQLKHRLRDIVNQFSNQLLNYEKPRISFHK